MTNREVVTAFLTAYQQHKYEDMHAQLDPGVQFSDMVFALRTGGEVRAMWKWFCSKTDEREPVKVPHFAVAMEEGDQVLAFYRVQYALPSAPRLIDYWIRADFTLRGGKIVRQQDTPTISDYRFAQMAKKYPAPLLALCPPLFRFPVRFVMRRKLKKFTGMESNS